MPSVMPGTVPGAMPGTVPNGPFAPDRMNATAYAPTESKRRKPAGPIVVLSILGLTFLSFAGLMGLIWVNDMGIIGIMRLGTIWIAAVCIVMGLVVIILGFRGRRTGGLIPLGLVAGGCALCMTIVSGTYGVYYRDLGASGINTVVSLSQSVSARNSDGMNDVQRMASSLPMPAMPRLKHCSKVWRSAVKTTTPIRQSLIGPIGTRHMDRTR